MNMRVKRIDAAHIETEDAIYLRQAVEAFDGNTYYLWYIPKDTGEDGRLVPGFDLITDRELLNELDAAYRETLQ